MSNKPKTELTYEDICLLLGVLDLFFERVKGEEESKIHHKLRKMAEESIP